VVENSVSAAEPSRTIGAGPSEPRPGDAINLGATVLPVLARTYWKQGLGALLLLALVVWLRKRG
jgi:hypothetical protein